MQPIVANVAALAVASLYYFWRWHHQSQQRQQRLCQRVAYMLWVAAQSIEGVDVSVLSHGGG